jgi:DNA polymerase-1
MMMYSMSEKGLAKRLRISEDDSLAIMSYFFKRFPKIQKKITELKYFCRANGYVETMWGRKRRLPDIWSEEWWIRKKAERQVLNSVVQGSAADVMKLAMLAVGYDQRIKDLGGILLLTVHDELILECPKNQAVEVAKLVVEDMTTVCELSVPLKVDAELFMDGRWYGESVNLKRKGDDWVLLKDSEKIDEEQLFVESMSMGDSHYN